MPNWKRLRRRSIAPSWTARRRSFARQSNAHARKRSSSRSKPYNHHQPMARLMTATRKKSRQGQTRKKNERTTTRRNFQALSSRQPASDHGTRIHAPLRTADNSHSFGPGNRRIGQQGNAQKKPERQYACAKKHTRRRRAQTKRTEQQPVSQ